jgi:hypothetical protein
MFGLRFALFCLSYCLVLGWCPQISFSQDPPQRQTLPLRLRLLGYAVGEKGTMVLLQIDDGKPVSLRAGAKLTVKLPTQALAALPELGQKAPSVAPETVVLSFAKEESLNVENRTLLLGAEPFKVISCPLGEWVEWNASESPNEE